MRPAVIRGNMVSDELEDEKVARWHVDCAKLKFSLVEPVDEQNDNAEELLPIVTSEVVWDISWAGCYKNKD